MKFFLKIIIYKLQQDKTSKLTGEPSEDTSQTGHLKDTWSDQKLHFWKA